MNVFVKPDDQSSNSLEDWHGEKMSMIMNVFVKPEDQSQARLKIGMARK